MTANESPPTPSSTVSDPETDTSELIRKLQQSGKLQKIENDFVAKLIKCGWRDDMKDVAKEAIRDSGGAIQVTLDHIVDKVLPAGRASVPPVLEDDVIEQLRQVLRQER